MCVVSAKGAAFLLSPPKDGFAVANLGQRPRNSPAPTSPSAEGAIHVVATGSPQDESVRGADLWPVGLVGRAVLCPPPLVQKIGAHGVARPTWQRLLGKQRVSRCVLLA